MKTNPDPGAPVSDPAESETIRVRQYGGTYIARVLKTRCNASCTSGPDQAAETVAKKFAQGRTYEIHPHITGEGIRVWKLKVSGIWNQASGIGEGGLP